MSQRTTARYSAIHQRIPDQRPHRPIRAGEQRNGDAEHQPEQTLPGEIELTRATQTPAITSVRTGWGSTVRSSWPPPRQRQRAESPRGHRPWRRGVCRPCRQSRVIGPANSRKQHGHPEQTDHDGNRHRRWIAPARPWPDRPGRDLPEQRAAGAREPDDDDEAGAEHDRPDPAAARRASRVASRISSLPMKPDSGGMPAIAIAARKNRPASRSAARSAAAGTSRSPPRAARCARRDRRAGTAPRRRGCCAAA